MELTQEQIDQVVLAAQNEIRERATKHAADAMQHVIEHAVKSALHEEVAAFIKAEIAPAIRERLVAERPALVEAAVVGAHGCAKALAEAMVAQVTKVLATDWDRSAALKALLGVR
jgi:hypothetical protein